MSLVPTSDVLLAEVWIEHDDIGFVSTGQRSKVKLAAYPFQKYGMLEGQVKHVSADATDAGANPNSSANDPRSQTTPNQSGGGYKALVALKSTELDAQGRRFALAAGMRVTAEIHLGTRSVLEYLLSPVTKTVMEAGRER